jgi:hypothetical protein
MDLVGPGNRNDDTIIGAAVSQLKTPPSSLPTAQKAAKLPTVAPRWPTCCLAAYWCDSVSLGEAAPSARVATSR